MSLRVYQQEMKNYAGCSEWKINIQKQFFSQFSVSNTMGHVQSSTITINLKTSNCLALNTVVYHMLTNEPISLLHFTPLILSTLCVVP